MPSHNRPHTDASHPSRLPIHTGSGNAALVAFRIGHGDPGVGALAAIPQLDGPTGDQPGDDLVPVIRADAKVEVEPIVFPPGTARTGSWFVRFPFGFIR